MANSDVNRALPILAEEGEDEGRQRLQSPFFPPPRPHPISRRLPHQNRLLCRQDGNDTT